MLNAQTPYKFAASSQRPVTVQGSSDSVNLNSSKLDTQFPGSIGKDSLSIALIGPDDLQRSEVSLVIAGCGGSDIREFSSYPPGLDDVPRILEQNYDVIIIDLDSDQEYALELVESLCAQGSATIMVYSAGTDSDLLVRCMRAGAREFLTLPFAHDTVAEALVRASCRRPAARAPKKLNGKLLVFLGAKGGAGVTTICCNYAVALAHDSSQNTLLIDLDLPLGDAALNLGIVSEYSTVNALQDFNRLDSSFLAKLVVKHSSGLHVLAAPGKFPYFQTSLEAVERLLTVARQDFDNVVVDMGSRFELIDAPIFKEAFTVYLVSQASICELRNSNRIISQLFSGDGPRLEIVINRYESRSLVVTEEQITKALTRPIAWKIPNDHASVRKMQSTATPLTLTDSAISRQIRQMASSINPQPEVAAKKKGFKLFG